MQYRDLLSLYADSRTAPSYIRAYAVFCFGYVLDFFDFFLVGFLLVVIGPAWHLTDGQSSMILVFYRYDPTGQPLAPPAAVRFHAAS
jgi:putative MFS transporter